MDFFLKKYSIDLSQLLNVFAVPFFKKIDIFPWKNIEKGNRFLIQWQNCHRVLLCAHGIIGL